MSPVGSVKSVLRFGSSLQRLLGDSPTPPSPLLRRRSLGRRFDTLSFPFAALRAAAKQHDCSVNDAYLAGLCGGLRLYHQRHGTAVETMSLALPVNLRQADDPAAGNQWAAVRISAPIGEHDAVRRMQLIHQQVLDGRTEPALNAMTVAAPALAKLPTELIVSMAEGVMCDVQASNVPGHAQDTYIGGVTDSPQLSVRPAARQRDDDRHGVARRPVLPRSPLRHSLRDGPGRLRRLPHGRLRRGVRGRSTTRRSTTRRSTVRRQAPTAPGGHGVAIVSTTLLLPGSASEVEGGPTGASIGAFFDLDGTLIAGYSARYLSEDRLRRRDIGAAEMLRTLALAVYAGVGRASFEDALSMGAQAWRGRAHEDLEEMAQRLFLTRISDRIFPEMRELVRAHQAQGHTVALISSATNYQVEPVADYLGVDAVRCNRFMVSDGLLTGEIERPVLWGPRKADAAQTLAAELSVDLSRSYFYADGDEDVALMHLVGHPRPTNPGKQLAKVAAKRGWPVLRPRSRTAGGLPEQLKSVAGMGLAVPVGAGGLAVGLAKRQKRAGINFAIEHWLDALLALNGVKIRVHGRENAWSHRPAVFVFNHRNNFDPFIAASVVRRNFTGVAKKELARNPLMGTAGRLMDLAFVDRNDSRQSVAAVKSLTDQVDKGLSMLVAPEGTRVDTTGVGPFKKGAFWAAMATGAPVVPIVIRNAELIAGRNATSMNAGTVDVAVLPPIPTTDWTRRNLSVHVESVRQRFLDTLAEWPPHDA